MKNHLLMIVVILSQMVFGQNNVYKIDPIHTNRKVKELNFEPVIHMVKFKEVQIISGGVKRRIVNLPYVLLEKEIEALKEENIVLQIAFEKGYKRYNDLEEMKSSITKFLNSNSDFDSKKGLLIKAQSLALENGISELIYADESINRIKKTKFMLLKMNKLDLKVHLKRISWKLNSMVIQEPIKETAKEELLAARINQLANMPKYKYSKTKEFKTKKSGLYLDQKVPSANVLKGDFVMVGKYYILKTEVGNEFKKGEIVDSQEAISNQLAKKGAVGKQKFLFKNKATNVIYISDIDFLNNYAFTINGKFNKYIAIDTSSSSYLDKGVKLQLVSH